jgi:hypothetical protein
VISALLPFWKAVRRVTADIRRWDVPKSLGWDMSRDTMMPALHAVRVTVAGEEIRADFCAAGVGRHLSTSFIGFASGEACFGTDASVANETAGNPRRWPTPNVG